MQLYEAICKICQHMKNHEKSFFLHGNFAGHLHNQATIESPLHCRVSSNFARKQLKSRTRTLTQRIHNCRPRSL